MQSLSRIMRAFRIEMKSSEKVIQKVQMERKLMTAIRKRQLQFDGHIIGHR